MSGDHTLETKSGTHSSNKRTKLENEAYLESEAPDGYFSDGNDSIKICPLKIKNILKNN